MAYSSQHSSICHLEISDRFVNKTTIKRKLRMQSRRRTFFFIWAQNGDGVCATNQMEIFILMFCDAKTISGAAAATSYRRRNGRRTSQFVFVRFCFDWFCLPLKRNAWALSGRRHVRDQFFPSSFLSSSFVYYYCVALVLGYGLFLLQIRNSFTEHISWWFLFHFFLDSAVSVRDLDAH